MYFKTNFILLCIKLHTMAQQKCNDTCYHTFVIQCYTDVDHYRSLQTCPLAKGTPSNPISLPLNCT